MNLKQFFLTIIVLFTIDSVAMSQVKKQYRDDVHKSTTVVIKEDGASDLDILNSQFNLDDFKVNEQIKITTDQSITPAPTRLENVSGGQTAIPAPDLASATASANNNYERPKTKMKRWSVREKKETTATEEVAVINIKEEAIVAEKPVRTKRIRNSTKTTSTKSRKKSKKIKKKRKKTRKLKNRKRKSRRNKNGACYSF